MPLETYSQDIVDTVREPLLMLDTTLRVHSANRAFYQTFHVTLDETENHPIYELGNGQWDIPDLRRLLEDVVPKSLVFNDFELVHTFPSIGRRVMLLNARQLKAGNHGELLVLAMEDVTERRRAEEEVLKAAADLKAIEMFSQNIVDTVREPLLMLDTTLRVHSANRAFYQTFHVSPEETEGHLIYELGNGQWDIPNLRKLLEDVVPKSLVFNDFELQHDFPAIGRRVMLLNARQLLAGSHGELLVLAMEDVTERRHAEEEVLKAAEDLKAIETFSENIVDTVREPLLTLDSTLRVHSANRAFYQTFHVSADETEGRLIYELGNGQWDIPALRTLLEDVVPKSSVFNDFELEHTFPAIGRRVMLLNARKLQAGNHGELLVLAMEDVTERKRAAEQQRSASAYARSLIEASPDPLLTISPEGKITDANQATELVTGIPRQRLIGTDFSDYFTKPEHARTGYQEVFSHGFVRDYPLAIRHTSGRVTDVLYNATLYRNETGTVLGVFAAARDVTERKRIEEEVARAKETAETANRTKSLFLANMSHELRTPLNAILGFSEMLQEEATEQGIDGFLPDLEQIHIAGKHLLSLINDILDLSKIEAGKMQIYLESFDVPTLIDEVVETIRPLVNANANTLRVQCSPDLGSMHADMAKTRQSLFNLLSNAAKFTSDGAISLDVSKEVVDGRDWMWFRVSDTGIGMTPEQLVKLFQTFSQADTSTTRKFGGSGLGLALTRRFCQLMGGDVTVNSVPGESSTFTLKIPAVVMEPDLFDADGAAAVEHPAAAANIARPVLVDIDTLPTIGSSILVVDDDAVQRDLMSRFLIGEGFAVETASDGEEGLRLARKHLPVAITLDVMMPGMDGWTALSRLKSDPLLSSIPVIMITMMDDQMRGYALGAADYITKPTDRRRLAQVLRKHSCPHPPCPVLLVEDDAMTRQMMRVMLEKAGWAVSEAENGRDALECVRTNRPALILLDLTMPEMDGFEFAAELHRRPESRSIPIVVLTGKDLTDDEMRRLNGNVDTILDKGGCSREQLMTQVRDLLAGWVAPGNRGDRQYLPVGSEGIEAKSHV